MTFTKTPTEVYNGPSNPDTYEPVKGDVIKLFEETIAAIPQVGGRIIARYESLSVLLADDTLTTDLPDGALYQVGELGNYGYLLEKRATEPTGPGSLIKHQNGNGVWFAIPHNRTRIIAAGGQSNSIGSAGATSPVWPETNLIHAFRDATNAFAYVKDMQGLEPFNADGSNNAFIWAADELARRFGILTVFYFASEGSTEIVQWTGGGYQNGVAITANRTISASNRVQFKKWTDALVSQPIDQFDAFFWHQGEADLDTPGDVYQSELDYLRSQVAGLGTSGSSSRLLPMVVGGLYKGFKESQQTYRDVDLQLFAQRNSGIEYADSSGIEGRDDGGEIIINHFTNDGYTQLGYRYFQKYMALDGAGGGATPLNNVVERVIIKREDSAPATLGIMPRPVILGNGDLFIADKDRHLKGEMFYLGTNISANIRMPLNTSLNQTLGDAHWFRVHLVATTSSVTIVGNGNSVFDYTNGGNAANLTLTGGNKILTVQYSANRWIVTVN